MAGHITERRPGVWRIVISNGSGPDGKRRQYVETYKGTRRDAKRLLTKRLGEQDDGKLSDSRQPLEVYLVGWLEGVSKVSKRGRALAPTTKDRYAGAVGHISRIIGRVRLRDLRASHVEHLRDELLGEGRLKAQSVSDVMRVLAQALSKAEAQGFCRNWADPRFVNRPVGRRSEFTVIDAELGTKILEAVRGTDPWDVAAHLGLGLGLRREEVLGLRWQDVDDDAGVVHVVQTLTYAAGEYHVGPPKSDAGERDLQVPDFVARSIRRHKAAQAERLLAIGIHPELVVDSGIGEPWMPASFSTGWRRFAQANGFPGVTFHTLRHGAATLMLAAGVSDAVAINVMGHADTKILRRYQEVVSELQRDAATRMDGLLGKGSG